MTISIELDIDASEQEVRLTLLDAFAEFSANRGPTSEDYVNRRYPDSAVYAGSRRDEKILQVERRKNIAKALHQGAFEVRFTS